MKKHFYFLVLVSLFVSLDVFAQKGKDGAETIATAGVIFNRYTTLAQTATVGATSIVVGNVTDLAAAAIAGAANNPYATGALSSCDLLMIIKMQGAAINTTNAAAYGTITNYNGVGDYELVEVGSITGNTITLAANCSISKGYTVSPTQRVQVIRIPRITNLTINAASSLTSRAWGTVANTGGVVAVETNGTAVINGTITVQGQGFRGGQLDNNTANGGTDFVSNLNTAGGEKGESIVGFQTDYDALGGRYCKGAPANGGGGGTNHNCGGGGGSNGDNGVAYNGDGIPSLTTAGWATAWNLEAAGFSTNNTSGGGRGGYSFGFSNQNALTLAPGNAAWAGDSRRNHGGKGGRPLNSLANTRIFFGGGGGAGDGNNNANQVGASGGGIVYLISDGNISGTGSIIANGNNALPTVPAHNDAPGGGGGGGAAVILSGGTLTGVTINANGGTGGSQLITNDESEGPGGGGGGGYVLTTTTGVTRTVNGGANGTTSSNAVTEFIPNGATQGAAGGIVNNIAFPASVSRVDLVLASSGNAGPFCVGGSKTYTVIITNSLSCTAASNVTVNIPTPAGITFTSTVPTSGTFTSPNWTLATLAANASATLVISGVITNTTFAAFTGTASSANTECASTNNTISLAGSTATIATLPVTASPTAACSGASSTLTASGATTYTWSFGSNLATVTSPTISATTTFTVLGTTPAGCAGMGTVQVTLNNCPTAISNTNTTIQNTPVSGNAGTNDINAAGGTFTNGQPIAGTGTLTMNPATGQYTYTPATGFTGTTVATYTLCNGSPVVCSSTTITFSVFPTLVAVSNTVITAPATPTTGNLLTNDLGIGAPGATYSTSITQPATTTGTFVINPATGQYTFNPNPAFTGTAQTTYTVCNTAVSPTVCSNTTITIQVGSLPVAVSNTNTTMQNTPVSGNAGANDTGTNVGLSPVFTNGQPTAGTGTLVMNPSTGQYTYTPATGFTGTTVATYTLCNLLSPPCSTTTITFTVFPTLVAVSNTVITAPATPTTGNLLTNDLGIGAPGATYSTSITQPATTTGTFVINPTTGQYTFNPNPAFTGTAQTTYTVCNTAVSPTVCSNTTITIQVGSLPVAVSNTNTTMQNTPVSGNAGTNDTGTNVGLSPVFTNGQPTAGTGTLVMNPSTGQYTYTPATGFTGTTVATYTLCNLLSPPCSTTTITFTVFPTLVANPNLIATTPSVSATGNLLTNDLGTSTPGGTYSVTVTQPAPTTGTIVLNPATGQYTFNPNPLFTGTAQTTYTVCNTAVTPSVCSSTTITIQVGSLPVAVADATTTMQGTPVSGTVATNDSGAGSSLSPVFTHSQPTAGTGTLTMNPSTGQYTYTPAVGFTGTTVATYTLCNLSSPPCSTTTITFSVFPTLTAIANTITTAPATPTTGNLLTNDLGIGAPGATYSTSVTQPAPTTGTIVLNPATGQYTFNPNPAFTGTAQTTYTVCNTAVNPTVCSNTTITIQVGSLPLAVADATTTMQNTSVSGTVATNDTGANTGLSPVFTNSQPTAGTGTLVMNPSTGQYTYTPATGFTGTTVATYTLCNLLSPPCSSTTITFTVFPTLVANPDPIVTTPSVSTTGNLLTNDLGTSTLGGTYSVSVTQPSPTTGTIVLNPATGQYTFVPNPSFTGTAQTTYTVCNTAVTPSVCSSSTITITVSDLPVAVADQTVTIINTAVSGTVATNDSGTSGGTFTHSQPTTGTLTMNPSTGQYTYTPATGFTGTTVATYTLCNLASPPCSTTTITFTVFPALVAVDDVIVTTPSVSVTGTLTTNDLGLVVGGTYSSTVTQPAPTTGTIVLNSATGQYTFVPNPSFTGTAQTTYTICQFVPPSTVAIQCSTATITINVSDLPIAVADQTVTIINTPVSGTVATNDSGTSGGTFTNSQPTAGTGTLVMNPSTGQYTFTPATGFTGTTVATYTLCNLASPPCSTTTITFTVFPALVAVDDPIVTTPSVSVTGTLTGNDLGLVPGGTYSTTVTQPSPTTGTITINPATGQYTFVPNPSFTGTAQTTYTICQYVPPSTVAIQCSTATITINVSNVPVAVNDATVTLINTPVSGTVATNDLGVSGGTFTAGNPTTGTGTVTMNPSTGEYTFTPATGFTGTTSITYTVCAGVPVTCVTAVLTVTVYPALVAVDDPIVTTPSVSVTGTLTGNDLGLVTGGTYSTTVTQPSPTTGTIIINPATGQYTFVPNPTFTGTAQTTYTICQYVPPSTVAIQCSTATITINVSNVPIAVNDATVTLINTPVSGTVATNDVGVSSGTFTPGNPTTGTGTVTMNPSTGEYTFTPATGFTGTTSITYTVCAGVPVTCVTAVLTVTVYPALVAVDDPIVTTPSVSVTGTLTGNDGGLVPGGTYSTTVTQPSSTTGTIIINPATGQYTFVPNPSFTGTAQTTYTICQYVPPSTVAIQCSTATITINVSNTPPPIIGVAKSATKPEFDGNGCYKVTFKFTVKNYGATPIYSVTVTDNLNNTFVTPATYTVVSMPISSNGILIANAGFNGSSDINLVSSTSSLAVGQTDTISITVRYCTNSGASVTYSNIALASGNNSPTGTGVTSTVVSTNGTNPDPNGNGIPNETGEQEPTVFVGTGELVIPQGFSPNGDGVNDLFVIKGIGAYPNSKLNILNRWGNLVYKMDGYDNTWNGKSSEGIRYGSDDLPEGTYFYILDLGNGDKPYKGFIYLSKGTTK